MTTPSAVVHPVPVVVGLLDAQGQLLPSGPSRHQRWRQDLCCCHCTVCLCVTFFPFVPLGQLYEKTIGANTRPRGRCIPVVLMFVLFHFLAYNLSTTSDAQTIARPKQTRESQLFEIRANVTAGTTSTSVTAGTTSTSVTAGTTSISVTAGTTSTSVTRAGNLRGKMVHSTDDKGDTLNIQTSHGGSIAAHETLKLVRAMLGILHCAMWVYFVLTIRATIRAQYRIPEVYCQGMEDFCCACWCTPFVLCQMMQHVYAYSVTGGTPCNTTATGDPYGIDLNLAHMPVKTTVAAATVDALDKV